MMHSPNHKQPESPQTLADALIRDEKDKQSVKWYQEYLANKERYQRENIK